MPKNQSSAKDLRVTSADEWGHQEGFLAELPSGKVARIRRTMNIVTLLKTGQLPNPLAKVINGMIQGKATTFKQEELDENMLRELLILVDATVMEMMLEPRVEEPDPNQPDWKPSPGAISIESVDIDDRFYLFGIGQGGPLDLESFRQEQAAAMAAPQPGEGVQPKAKQPAGASK